MTTDRLVLRAFRDGDLDAYAAMCADPEVMRYLSTTGALLSREDAWRQMALFAGHWTLRGYGMWAVEERDGGRFVGRVGLHRPEGWPDLELGWSLCREAWGKGYATEAARAASGYAFRELKRTYLIHLILPENVRSIRVAERLGARAVGTAVVRGVEQLLYRLDAKDAPPASR